MELNVTPGLGHNNPPDPISDSIAAYGDAIEEAQHWLDGSEVENEDQMRAVDELLTAIKAAEKGAKAGEEAEAKPLYDLYKAAKARWRPTLDDLARLKKGLAALVSDFKKKLAAEKAEAQREAQEEADRKRQEAIEAARIAQVSDIESQRAADIAAAQALAAQAAASRAKNDRVRGLRTVAKYEINDHREALHWIAINDRDAVTAFIEEYVRKNHREKAIAGVRSWTEKEAF
ncbi:MAG: hypothetical protein AAF565_17950 [Pseudomonadota bacterium]